MQLRQHGTFSARGSSARKSAFARLTSVALRNFYFPAGDLTDAGMLIEPEPFTAELMQSLGLLLIVEPDGFAVAYDSTGAGFGRLLKAWARGLYLDDPLRLGFLVRFEDHLFVNYSTVPFELDPTREALYVDNVEQLRPGQTYEIHKSSNDVLDLEPSVFRVDFIPGSEFVVVRNLFGQEVRCYPRSVSNQAARLRDPSDYDCQDYDPDGRTREFVYVSLAALPDGKYEVVFLDGAKQQIGALGWRLYLSSPQNTLLFIQLILAPDDYLPEGPILTGRAGFPTPDQLRLDPPPLPDFDYSVAFGAREVWFQFVVVLPAEDNPYHRLRIRAKQPPGLEFERATGSFQGRPAVLFTATAPLRLQKVPEYELALVGRDERRGRGQQVLVERLPIPGPAHLTRDDRRITSKAYVYI